MAAYYNEFDPFAAAWLRELIKAGLIADGEVDERSITDVQPDDVRGFTQCHFFAGIGGWSYALRLAGWPDDRPVWTGSCPCQPFSAAGANLGGDDPRHLWPAWFRLIRECQPAVVFGEQVESAIAHGWLDLVCDDLEGEGYAVGAAGIPACGVGAFHIRQRLWFVADATGSRPLTSGRGSAGARRIQQQPKQFGAVGVMADTERGATERHRLNVGSAAGRAQGPAQKRERVRDDAGNGESVGELGHSDIGGRKRSGEPEPQGVESTRREQLSGSGAGRADAAPEQLGQPLGTGSQRFTGDGDHRHQPRRHDSEPGGSVTPTGAWDNLLWLPCRDGKTRPTQSGLFPLAHGVSGRVGRLRGYGNAIVPEVAQAFIESYLEATA